MKKITLLIIFSTFFTNIHGQLNPIENLTFWQTYNGGQNEYQMNWDIPNLENDTLIGYNIYKEEEFFRFQTDNFICHVWPDTAPPCLNDDPGFLLENAPFWVHVTAVYNSTHEESSYNDSVYVTGALIGIHEIKPRKPMIYPNPANGILRINSENVQKIAVFDLTGKMIKKFKATPKIDLSDLPKGIYLIKLITEREKYIKKIVLK